MPTRRREPKWKRHPKTPIQIVRYAIDSAMRNWGLGLKGRRVWTWVIEMPDKKKMKVARMPFMEKNGEFTLNFIYGIHGRAIGHSNEKAEVYWVITRMVDHRITALFPNVFP